MGPLGSWAHSLGLFVHWQWAESRSQARKALCSGATCLSSLFVFCPYCPLCNMLSLPRSLMIFGEIERRIQVTDESVGDWRSQVTCWGFAGFSPQNARPGSFLGTRSLQQVFPKCNQTPHPWILVSVQMVPRGDLRPSPHPHWAWTIQ